MATSAALDVAGLCGFGRCAWLARPLRADAAKDLDDRVVAAGRTWRCDAGSLAHAHLVGASRCLLCVAARGGDLEALAASQSRTGISERADDSLVLYVRRRWRGASLYAACRGATAPLAIRSERQPVGGDADRRDRLSLHASTGGTDLQHSGVGRLSTVGGPRSASGLRRLARPSGPTISVAGLRANHHARRRLAEDPRAIPNQHGNR